MAAEDSAIGVQLVDHDVAQILKQPRPAGVVRQDSCVQHVWVGQDDVALLADGFARVARRVAVIRENAKAIREPLVQIMKLRELILRQRLGGEEIQRAAVRAFQNRVQDGQVVAKRFSGGRRGDDHHVPAGSNCFHSGSLVAIELANAFAEISRPQIAVRPGREVRPLRLARWIVANSGEDFAMNIASGERIEDFMDASDRRRAARWYSTIGNRRPRSASPANRQ